MNEVAGDHVALVVNWRDLGESIGLRRNTAGFGEVKSLAENATRAYVASTYNELLFKSDVYQAFLDFADSKSVPLASTEWRRHVGSEGPQ